MKLRIFLLLTMIGFGCAKEPLPDFRLTDVNETSPRFGDSVSPRQYLHRVTAFYFGAST